jgi:outer membrane protein assembly factor BamB
VNTESGKQLWDRSFRDAEWIAPSNGQALIGSDDRVVAVDAFSGTERWSHALISGSITATRLYGLIDNTDSDEIDIVALDLDGGREVWRVSLKDQNYFPASHSMKSGAMLYINLLDTLYMVDPSTGKLRGIYKARTSIGGSDDTAVEVGDLTVVNDGNRLVALRREQ